MGEKKLFGTDGVRGVANREPMMVEMAVNLGRAVAYVLMERKGGKRPRVVIGKDTRLSGYMLENALVAGLCSMGADALLVGTLPTPGIAVLADRPEGGGRGLRDFRFAQSLPGQRNQIVLVRRLQAA